MPDMLQLVITAIDPKHREDEGPPIEVAVQFRGRKPGARQLRDFLKLCKDVLENDALEGQVDGAAASVD